MKYIIKILLGIIVIFYFIIKEEHTMNDLLIGIVIILIISVSFYFHYKLDKKEKK